MIKVSSMSTKVVDTNGLEQWYISLQRQGVPAKVVEELREKGAATWVKEVRRKTTPVVDEKGKEVDQLFSAAAMEVCRYEVERESLETKTVDSSPFDAFEDAPKPMKEIK